MHPAPTAHSIRKARLATALTLLAIVLLGAALRFTGLDWDDGQHLHPDERFLTMVENSLSWPATLSDYWDTAQSPLNPYNRGHGSYVYGVLPVFITKAVGQLTGLTGYGGVYLAGRAVSGVMDLLCVVLVYAIGARLYDRRVGLLGAALLSFAVLNIQQSHYFTVDTTLTFLVTLAFYLAVCVAQGDRWRDRILLGLVFGLAVACKISVLTFGLVIALAFVLAAWRRGGLDKAIVWWRSRRLGRYQLKLGLQQVASTQGASWDWFALKSLELLPAAVIIILLAALAFRVAQPHAFQGPGLFGLSINPQWKDDMSYVRRLVSGEIDYPPSHQWASRPAVWYMLKNLVLWGVGLPMGLAIWLGWALMAWELLKGRRAHLLPWSWMTFTFGYQSIQFVKAMRYILPIYPTMALVAAYGLVRLWDAVGTARRSRWLAALGRGLVVGVVLATALWALAFTSIYTRPVTRITASRWVYDNIPPGSTISYELWDDPVPMNVDGRLASDDYVMIRMEPYWEDVPEKREALLQWLDQTGYIILSSNRLYGSIPRLPQRYPMTTRYYQMLFSGELGYEQIAEFTSRPGLLGLEFVDDNADESFTVYDHPKVTIFRKTAAFDLPAIRAEFERFDLERVVRVKPIDVERAPNGLMLSEQALVVHRAGGTWSELYDRQSAANRWPTLYWLLALYAVQVAVWPLTACLGRSLPDAGYGLSKALGLLLVAYLSWLLPAMGVARYSSGGVWGAIAALAVLSGLLWRHGDALLRLLRRRWRLLVSQEALFLLLFAAMWLIRRANPDLWHPVVGGEKPMDLAYLNAVLKSSTFPPYDPWFAGGTMNYYYWGWVVIGALVKLTGIVPEVAYNLALPTLYALLGAGIASLLTAAAGAKACDDRWLPHGLRVGLLGVALVAVVGNLGEIRLLAQGLMSLGAARTMPGTPGVGRLLVGLWAKITTGAPMPFRQEWWYWNATRVMAQGEINEFPFFSYLYGDLHAHVMALPFTVLTLGLGLMAMRRLQAVSAETDWDALATPGAWVRWVTLYLPQLAGPLLALSLSLGALWCINTWDWPTYTGVACVALLLGGSHGRRTGRLKALGAAAGLAFLVVLLSRALYQPYHAHYGMAYSKIALWKGARTSLGALLTIYALPLFVLGAWLVRCTRSNALAVVWRYVALTRRYGSRRTRQLMGVLMRHDLSLDGLFGAAMLCLAIMLLAALGGQWTLGVAAPLGLLALCELLSAPTLERRLIALLAGSMLFLMLLVDWVVLGGDVGRMNTVFKFSLQAWVLGGLASPLALGRLLQRGARWQGWAKAVLVLLLCAVALYPPLATYGRIHDRWPESTYRGLDGSAFMTEATYQDGEVRYTLAHDLSAVHWLQAHVSGSPVIIEAVTPLYRWGGRVSVHTGLPTVLGWDWHQRQQRASVSGHVVDWRLEDVDRCYNSLDVEEALRIIARYDVALIYVGEVERAYYDAAGLAKFDAMVGSSLELVYDQWPVRIYQVMGADVVAAAGQHDAADQGFVAVARAWLDRHIIWGPVRAEGGAGEGLLLEQPVDTLPIADIGWNTLANRHWPLAVLGWYLSLQLLGWGALGLAAPILSFMDDRGHGLSKGLGLVLVAYVVWLSANLGLATNTSGIIWGVTLALAGIGTLVAWRRGSLRRMPWRIVLIQEGVFAAALLALVLVRLLNPDLWQPWYGGEKLMESAYLQAVARSKTMPPYDPYFAGGRLNYYYLGLFQANIPLKLVGLRPEIAFNLAVPMLFALTACHAFWAGRQLAGGASRVGWAGGVVALLLVVVMGNLTSGIQLAEQVAQVGVAAHGEATSALRAFAVGLREVLGGRATLPAFDYWWRATRVIPFTINEFPFFGFLFADLHPHLTALPLTTLTVALLVAAVRAPRRLLAPLGLLLALVYGALGPANTWDLPALGLAVLAGGLVWGAATGGRRAVFRGLVWALLVVAFGLGLYAPFYRHYEAQGIGLGLVGAQQRSSLLHWLQLWGLFVVAVLALLLVVPTKRTRAQWLARLAVALPTLTAGIALALLGAETLGLLMPLLAGAMWLALTQRECAEAALRHALIALALAILAGVEVVYLRDFLDGSEWSRMNTVFKFHLQAWVLLGIALGGSWPRLWQGLKGLGWVGGTLRGVLSTLGAVALLYPLLATPVRIAERMPYGEPPRWTLDGIAFMETGAYDWPDEHNRIELRHDLQVIRWLQAQAPGNAVVAEAPIGYYREGGLRIASFTGLPTLVGMHQGEQRPWTQVTPRQQDAEVIYTSAEPQRVAEVLARLRVRYVYWGQLERAAFPHSNGRAFARLEEQGVLQRVYENAGGVLYEHTLQR